METLGLEQSLLLVANSLTLEENERIFNLVKNGSFLTELILKMLVYSFMPNVI